MNKTEAIKATLDGHVVIAQDGTEIAWNGEGFVIATSPRYVPSWASYPSEGWSIKKEFTVRSMTRMEILNFLRNKQDKVYVRLFQGDWLLPACLSFNEEDNTTYYEYTYVNDDGSVGEPVEFEVEE